MQSLFFSVVFNFEEALYVEYQSYFQDQQQKMVNMMERITRETLKLIKREREEMESKSNQRKKRIQFFIICTKSWFGIYTN